MSDRNTDAATKRRHVVQFSTGLGSAEVLRRVAEQYSLAVYFFLSGVAALVELSHAF